MRFLAHLSKQKRRARFALFIGTATRMSALLGRDDIAYCRCQRGAKEYRTRIALREADGALRFDQELQFEATLYAEHDAPVFDPKPFTIAVVNETDPERAPLQAQVDLASMLAPTPAANAVAERFRLLDLSPRPTTAVVSLLDPNADNGDAITNGTQIYVLFRGVLCDGHEHEVLRRPSSSVFQCESQTLTAPRAAPKVNSFSAPREKVGSRTQLEMDVFTAAPAKVTPPNSNSNELPSISALKESDGGILADIGSGAKADDDGFSSQAGRLSTAFALLGASPPTSQKSPRQHSIS